MNFKKYLFLVLVFPSVLFAQNISGVATYQSATQLDMKLDSTKIPSEMMKVINAQMRKELFKEFTLEFNKSSSIFKVVESLDQDGGSGIGGMIMMMSGGGGGLVYKNLQEKSQLEQKEFFGKLFLITDSLKLPEWKLEKETKQIGSYTCFKATSKREIISKVLSTEETEQKTDTTFLTITAWYTPQIPLSHGPDLYWGLPGFIMEISNGSTSFLCTKMELNLTQEKIIDAPKKGEKVTRDEYTSIVMKKMEEMRKMNSNRSGGPYGGKGSMEIKISR